jgi:hypothetical protein
MRNYIPKAMVMVARAESTPLAQKLPNTSYQEQIRTFSAPPYFCHSA